MSSNTSESSSRAENSCDTCRRRKKKCDRIIPSCSSCTRYLYKCTYPTRTPGVKVQRLSERLEKLEGLLTSACDYKPLGPVCWFLQTLDLDRVSGPSPFPVASNWYMPKLLEHFTSIQDAVEAGPVVASSVNDQSIAYKLRYIWIPNALNDPCMFHSSMYGASAHYDTLSGQSESSITLYHRAETLRLLKEQLSCSGEVNDSMVASALTMAHMEGLGLDLYARKIHIQGLRQMIKCRGGLKKLGFEGLLADLIVVGIYHSAIASGTEPAAEYADLLNIEINPVSPRSPIEFLSSIQKDNPDALNSHPSLKVIDRVLHNMYEIALAWVTFQQTLGKPLKSRWQFVQQSFLGLFSDSGVTSEASDPAIECCRLAALITWDIVDNTTPFSQNTINTYLGKLRSAIERTDQAFWIKYAPEAFIWICLTGATASPNKRDRSWFAVRFGPSIMVANHSLSLIRKAWVYSCWLGQRLRERVQHIEIAEE